MKAYKIVEVKDGAYFFLHHGLKKSRKIKPDVWLTADEKLVRDGSGRKYYTSGFHVFLNEETAKKYLKLFTRRTQDKKIVEVEITGILRIKHGAGNIKRGVVFLADKIKFPEYKPGLKYSTINYPNKWDEAWCILNTSIEPFMTVNTIDGDMALWETEHEALDFINNELNGEHMVIQYF